MPAIKAAQRSGHQTRTCSSMIDYLDGRWRWQTNSSELVADKSGSSGVSHDFTWLLLDKFFSLLDRAALPASLGRPADSLGGD
jgi:hypothetical protein